MSWFIVSICICIIHGEMHSEILEGQFAVSRRAMEVGAVADAQVPRDHAEQSDSAARPEGSPERS